MGFKGGVVLGTVSFNATGAGTTNIGATSNTGTLSIGNTSSGAVAINCGTAGITVGTTANAHTTTVGSTNTTSTTTVDCGTGGANFGTTANAHTTTVGSTNTTSATTVQSGSGALNVTATNGALTINSGTGAWSASTDASATTVNIATGAAAKTVTLGSTNSSSLLALRYGTSDMTLASATGTVMSALDTGEITYPLQSSFFAYNSVTDSNVTGDGTIYVVINDTEVWDQNADYNNVTGTFTAPVTGKYQFFATITISDIAAGHTTCNTDFNASNRIVRGHSDSPAAIQTASAIASYAYSCMVDMDAADTVTSRITIAGSTLTIDVVGAGSATTFFTGQLIA